jgi:hypothetical protein
MLSPAIAIIGAPAAKAKTVSSIERNPINKNHRSSIYQACMPKPKP